MYIFCDTSLPYVDVLQIMGPDGLNYMCNGPEPFQTLYTDEELAALFTSAGTEAPTTPTGMSEADFNALGGLTVSVFLIVVSIISVVRTIKIWR